ncbi:hypothetical protein PQX77_011154 [Marasmius sp. AFHP31]|nr:hypothetical protein PQX77_011154 [Marasmius sp. AFHP31]
MPRDHDEVAMGMAIERREDIQADEEDMIDVAPVLQRVGEARETRPRLLPSDPLLLPPKPTPLPVLSMVVLSIVMLSEFLSGNVSAPFILFMVKGFGVDDASFWAGILVATFFFSQFSSSMFWAAVASRTSPRLVLVVTLLGSAVSTFIFGCSRSLGAAIASRLVQGVFAGGIGVARGSVTSIADESNESRAWAILGFCWGMGGIAGAVIGGTFERPAEKWPSLLIFNNALFVKLPYLLPCTIASLVMLNGGFLACLLAPDVGPKKPKVSFDTEKLPVPLSPFDETENAFKLGTIRSSNPRSIYQRISHLFNNTADAQTPLLSSSFPKYSSMGAGENDSTFGDDNTKQSFPRMDIIESIAEPAVPIPLPLPPIPESHQGAVKEIEAVSGAKLPLALIVQYGLLALHTTTHDQVFLSYFVSPYTEGGVGLGAGDFARLIALMCIFQMFYQFYVYSKIGPPNGPFIHLTLFRISSILFIVSYLSVALYRGMFEGGSLMLALISSTAIRYCATTFAFTAIAILINSMTPLESVGYANGIAQSIASLARCVGPILGGSLWSLSTEANPSRFYLSFVTCAVACAAAFVHGLWIKSR